MDQGGVVPTEDSESDSALIDPLLGSTLLPGTPSTDTDTQETEPKGAGIDFNSISAEVLMASGLGLDFISTIPTANPDLFDRPRSEEQFLIDLEENAPTAPGVLGEIQRTSQLLVDSYNRDVDIYNEQNKSYREGEIAKYNNSIDGYNDKLDAANESFERFDLEATGALNSIIRSSTPESVSTVLNAQEEGKMLDLSGLVPNDEENPFKPRGLSATPFAQFQLGDLWEGDAQSFISMVDQITVENKEPLLGQINEEIEALEQAQIKIKGARSGQEASGFSENLNLTLKDGTEGSVGDKLKELKSGLDDESYIQDYRPTQARMWLETYVKESVALSETEWKDKILSSIGQGTHEDYLGKLEKQIYRDLLTSREAHEFTQALGMDGMKLLLEGGIELGERNSRWFDARTSWQIGVNELAKTIDATGVALSNNAMGSGGYLVNQGGSLENAEWSDFNPFRKDFWIDSPKQAEEREERKNLPTYGDFQREEAKSRLFERDEVSNRRIEELSQRLTQYAVSQKQLDQFGSNAIYNEANATEEYAGIYNDAKRHAIFSEEMLPAIQSMPLSYTAMGVGLLTMPLTGGSSLIASLTTGGLVGLGVSSRTFYDSYHNPIFYEKNEDGTTNWDRPNITETERHGMATWHGLAEGGGEFAGMLTTMGIGKFVLSPSRLSPYSVFKGKPKLVPQGRVPKGQVGAGQMRPWKAVAGGRYSGSRKLLDFGLGVAYGAGIGAGEEYIAEGLTGVSQMYIDSRYSDEVYTNAQYAERFLKDAKVGMWAGLATGGGAVTVGTARAQYQRVFRPETFNEKAAESYYHQLSNSGFFMNGIDKATRKKLKNELDIIAKETAKSFSYIDENGKVQEPEGVDHLKNQDTKQKEAIARVNKLIAKLDISKNRNIKALRAFATEGRYDLLAEMVEMDNNLLFLEAMSTEFTKGENGMWTDQNGNLTADPTGLEMYDMNVQLDEETRKEYKKRFTALKDRMEVFQMVAESGEYHSADYTAPDRKTEISNWESGTSDWEEISSDEEGNMEEAPTSGVRGIVAKFAQAAKGGARIIIHKTRASLKAVTGNETDNALYMEASPEQREGGKKDEIHIFVDENTSESEIKKDMTHEFGHYLFRDLMENAARREELTSEILTLAESNEAVREMVDGIKEAYKNYSQENLEREIINHFMSAVSDGGFRATDTTFSSNMFIEDGLVVTTEERLQNLNLSELTLGFEQWGLKLFGGTMTLGKADSAIRLAVKYTEFVRSQGGDTGVRTKAQGKALAEQTEATQSESTEEQTQGLGSRKLKGTTSSEQAKGFGYLSGKTITYTETVVDVTSEKGYTKYTEPVNRTIKVSDGFHFVNKWAYETGNGSSPKRMTDAHYMVDGRRFDVQSPVPVTNKKGDLIEKDTPYRKNYREHLVSKNEKTQEAQDILSKERAALMGEAGRLHYDAEKKIGLYTNFADFNPTKPEYTVPQKDTVDNMKSDIEDQKIAMANIQALIDSDITQEDLKDLRGRGDKINKQSHPEIFNMSGLRKAETFEQKAGRLNEDVLDFGAPWQLLPKDSPSYQKRIPDLRLASQEELEYASERMDKLKAGEPLEGDQLDFSPGIASRALKGQGKLRKIAGDIPAGWETADNYITWLIDLGYKAEDIVIDKYNYDPQVTGWVEFDIATEKGGRSAKFRFYSSGGVFGGQTWKDIGGGSNIVTSHSGDATSEAAMNSMIKADQNGKIHVSLFQVLSWGNSLNSPKQFSEVMNYVSKYIEHNPSHIPAIIDAINSKLENSAGGGVVGGRLGKFLPKTIKGKTVPGIDRITSGSKNTPSIKITSQEGLMFFLEEFGNIDRSIELGFVNDARAGFTNGIHAAIRTNIKNLEASKGNKKYKPHFISKADYLDKVNQSQYKNTKSGDVVAANLRKPGEVESVADLRNTLTYEEGTPAETFVKNIGYTNAVVTKSDVNTVFFKETVSGSIIDKTDHARKTSGHQIELTDAELAEAGGEIEGAGMASRRLPGRVYVEGNSKWEQSSPNPYGAVLERLAIRFQDKFSDVMLLQQDVEKFRGSKVPQSQDFEMAMDIMYGIVRTDLETLEIELDRINLTIKDSGLTAELVSDYLYAKHAPERNAFIMRNRPEMESGSGMTNQEAEEIINELESPEMVEVAGLVYDIVSNTRKTMREGGLEKSSTVEAWEAMYNNYMPLSGRAVDEMDDSNNAYPTGGAGMAVYGKTTKAAKGRPSKTGVNLIANVIMQNAMVKQRARKDQAMMSMYNLVKNNANESVWGIHSSSDPKMKVNEKGEMVAMNEFEMKSSRNMVPIRVNGEQHFIHFKKTDYADALNGMTGEKLGAVAKMMSGPMSLMRNAFTQYNPSFFVGNYFRDIHGALYNTLAEVEREGGIMHGYGIDSKKFTADVIKGSFTSLKALLNESAFGRDMKPEMREYLREWEKAGGRTGFSYSESINNVMENIRRQSETKSAARKGAEFAFSKPKQFFEYIAAMNESFENSIRLSSYIEARKAGVTKQRAAQLSKNITINFNKSGELGPSLNSIYLFFNASVQGVTRFGRSFQQLKSELPNNPAETKQWKTRVSSAQKLAAGSVLASAMQTLVNIAVSDRDDDGELVYNKYPDYRKERGFQIMTGGKNSVFIPLGYGYNMFNVAGVMLAEVASGERSFDDALMFMGLSAHSSFSPVAFGHSGTLGGSAIKGALPTVLKSPTDAFGFNETYFGGQVYQEQFPFGAETPESSLSFRSPEMVQEAAIALNEMTGGTDNIQGDVDINPDPYYYIMQSYWGGAGDFVEKTARLGRASYEMGRKKYNRLAGSRNSDEFVNNLLTMPKEEKPVVRFSDVPILKTIYGGPSRFYDFDLFEENRQDILQHVRELKNSRETPSNIDFAGIQQLKTQLKNIEDVLIVVREEKKKARDIEDYIEKGRKSYELQEAEREAIMIFNKMYEDLRGQYVSPKPGGIIPMDKIRKYIGTDE